MRLFLGTGDLHQAQTTCDVLGWLHMLLFLYGVMKMFILNSVLRNAMVQALSWTSWIFIWIACGKGVIFVQWQVYCSSFSQRPWALSLWFVFILWNSWNARGTELLMGSSEGGLRLMLYPSNSRIRPGQFHKQFISCQPLVPVG